MEGIIKIGFYILLVLGLIFTVVLFFYKKNIVEIIPGEGYILLAAVMAFASFVLLQKGTKAEAEKSSEQTNDLVKSAVNKIDSSATQLAKKTEGTVELITAHAGKVKDELDAKLLMIDAATAKLTNLQENQDILVQVDFELLHDQNDHDLDTDSYYFDFRDQITEGNYYELKLISDKKESTFASEIYSFLPYNESMTDTDKFNLDERFISAYKVLYTHPHAYDIQPLRVQFVLEMRSSNFNMEDLRKGDMVEFLLHKKGSNMADEKSLVSRRRRSRDYFKGGFESLFGIEDESKWPKSRLQMTIRLRNGLVLKCEKGKTNILGTDVDSGFYSTAKIIEVSR